MEFDSYTSAEMTLNYMQLERQLWAPVGRMVEEKNSWFPSSPLSNNEGRQHSSIPLSPWGTHAKIFGWAKSTAHAIDYVIFNTSH